MLKNLQTHKDGRYEWTSVDTGRGVKFTLDYWKDARRRGIYVSAYPVECAPRTDVQGKPFTQEIIEITDGFSVLVLPLERKSPKSLVGFAEFIDAELPEIARVFLKFGRESAQIPLKFHIERWRTIHVQDTAKVLEGLRR